MPAPLPIRDGLNPTRIRMPESIGEWATVVEYLASRFPRDAASLHAKVTAGEVVDAAGRPLNLESPVVPRADVFLYRDPPVEPVVPFGMDILYRDDALVVVDKPHFLATTPRGRFVVQTALTRLRRELGNDELSPAHRLDRLTAGVLIFTARTDARRPYQEMFRERSVRKVYEAVAADSSIPFPRTVVSRIVKDRGSLQAVEVPGEPNSETVVEKVRTDGRLALYRLHPRTGKTHQLRVHMASLGLPILGDSLYPTPHDIAADDYSDPLRLLARNIAFVDPLTGEDRFFESGRRLEPFAFS
ncbi:MAG: pseudouridine synthase [Rhodococcus sp. (in: high G+C Gram-positive bacteria)]